MRADQIDETITVDGFVLIRAHSCVIRNIPALKTHSLTFSAISISWVACHSLRKESR